MVMLEEWTHPVEIERDFSMIRKLREYWEALNDGMPPERSLIDPGAIKDILPYVLLVDFEHEPFRVRLRLTGTSIDDATGYNLTGRYLDEFFVEPLRVNLIALHQAYEFVAQTAQPYIGAYPQWPHQHQIPFGIFPLSVNGKVAQAISIEQAYGQVPPLELKTWRDCLAIHAAGYPSGA